MISFLLNDQLVHTDQPPGMVLLDFVRYRRQLTGTKIGCREGDCGACTILCGSLVNGSVEYKSMVSCLMPLANAAGKHIVTVEGINDQSRPTAVQRAVVDAAATQCGFCTPGIVMSLTGYCLQVNQAREANVSGNSAIAAVDGNICRCTGYKSIERAALAIERLMEERGAETALQFLVRTGVLPAYFGDVGDTLTSLIQLDSTGNGSTAGKVVARFVGGGTDLYVQRHEEMESSTGNYLFKLERAVEVSHDGLCMLKGSATVSDLMEFSQFVEYFPGAEQYKKLISSTPIRNMATISGNFVNASPIGDLTIFFLALDAILLLAGGDTVRRLPLRNFYLGYKTMNLKPGEYIGEIHFQLPPKGSIFNFEKVSKRTNLDIASVNTAMLMNMEPDGTIGHMAISAGGVGPVPAYLAATSRYLVGKSLSLETLEQAIDIAMGEISPISDARGSAAYKQLLLQQLIKAHFLPLFPEAVTQEVLQL